MMADINSHLLNILNRIDEIESDIEYITYEDFISEGRIKERIYTHLQVIGKEAYLLSLKVNAEEVSFDLRSLSQLRNVQYDENDKVNHANLWVIILIDLLEMKFNIQEEIIYLNVSA